MENLDNHENHNHDTQQTTDTGNTGTAANPDTVILDEPIKRGNTVITEIAVRMPTSGELRGSTLQALSELDVVALQKILPRITTPAINAQEVAKMPPSDLMQLGVKVAVFLLPKADREMVSPSV